MKTAISRSPIPESSPRGLIWICCLLLAIYAAWTIAVMATVDSTIDEPTLMRAGRLILRQGWADPIARLQGPVPLYFNQLLILTYPALEYSKSTLLLSRLGMLPFGLLAGWLTFLWTKAAFGPRPAVLALLLFAFNPMMIGYGGLIAVDMASCACALLALYAVWRYAQKPSLLRLAYAGAALGIAFATKYLALLLGPVAAIAVVLVAWSSSKGRRSRALAGSLGALVVLVLSATLALHACYGFQAGLSSTDSSHYASGTIGRLVEIPVLGRFLSLIPQPMLLGLDYQFEVSRGAHQIYLNGTFAHGHWDYYLWSLLLKTPEYALALLALACGLALFRRFRGEREPAAARSTWLLLGAGICVPLFYLSFFNRVQVGIRYVLPLYPPLLILAASATRALHAHASKAAGCALAGIATLAAVDTALQSPNLIAYFNTTSGGQGEGYRYFNTSNCDWGQLRVRGLERLRAEEGDGFTVLTALSGPRFGRVAIYIEDRAGHHPEDETRARHWLDAFEPVRHVGAAWWLYELEPETWEERACASADPLVEGDLAVAYLGAGRRDEARRHAHALPQKLVEPFQRLLEKPAPTASGDLDPHACVELARSWTLLGRADRADEILSDPRIMGFPAAIREAALARWSQRDFPGGIRLLEALRRSKPEVFSSLEYLWLLFEFYCSVSRYSEAVDLLEEHMDDLPDDLPQEIKSNIRKRLEDAQQLRDSGARMQTLR